MNTKNIQVVMPMAGRGSRFKNVAHTNAAYSVPKPLIDVLGHPMVYWAMRSLDELEIQPSNMYFIVLEEHIKEHNVEVVLQQTFGSDIHVIAIPEVTRGAVETVMAAKQYIDNDSGLIVSDSDHFFEGAEYARAIQEAPDTVDGIIPVFVPPDQEPKWSYSLCEQGNHIVAVGEKDAELAAKGAYANIGAYYFSRGKDFVAVAQATVDAEEMYGMPGKQEFFVAPMYQRLIENGKYISAVLLERVWGLGTPTDLEEFLASRHTK